MKLEKCSFKSSPASFNSRSLVYFARLHALGTPFRYGKQHQCKLLLIHSFFFLIYNFTSANNCMFISFIFILENKIEQIFLKQRPVAWIQTKKEFVETRKNASSKEDGVCWIQLSGEEWGAMSSCGFCRTTNLASVINVHHLLDLDHNLYIDIK